MATRLRRGHLADASKPPEPQASRVNPDEGQASPATVTCQMCHRAVPATQTLTMSGRQLCSGCACAWFEDEEE